MDTWTFLKSMLHLLHIGGAKTIVINCQNPKTISSRHDQIKCFFIYFIFLFYFTFHVCFFSFLFLLFFWSTRLYKPGALHNILFSWTSKMTQDALWVLTGLQGKRWMPQVIICRICCSCLVMPQLTNRLKLIVLSVLLSALHPGRMKDDCEINTHYHLGSHRRLSLSNHLAEVYNTPRAVSALGLVWHLPNHLSYPFYCSPHPG